MKLTWFGGTTVRIHIGGAILVVDAEGAPDGIDRAELVSGANVVVDGFGAGLPVVDVATWRPRKLPRMLDEGEELSKVNAWSVGPGAMLVEAVGEPPLLLLAGDVPPLGRWADSAVVALFGTGEALSHMGMAVLADTPPRLIALAGDEAAVDVAISALRDRLDGAGLVSLDAGLALEI